MDEREKHLPKWAQSALNDLRHQLQTQHESLKRELERLRPKVERLEVSNAAMLELLQCAAKGGHMTAKEIVQLLEGYTLQLVKDD
jgi:hypothetical protein